MKKITTLVLVMLISVFAAAQQTVAYDTLDAWQTAIADNCANTDLTFEDFDGILNSNCNVSILPDPDQECFDIDELEQGFTVRGDENLTMIAGAEGTFGNSPINFVVSNSILSKTILNFDPPVNAISFSLWEFLNDTENAEITLFDTNSEIIEVFNIESPNNELTFFSAISTELISRVETFNPVEDDPDTNNFEGTGGNSIGQLYFGAMGCMNLSVNETALNEISIFPNPASTIITISSPNNVNIKNVMLRNTLGQQFNVPFNNNSLNVSNLKAGVYFLTINSEKGSVTKKVLIK